MHHAVSFATAPDPDRAHKPSHRACDSVISIVAREKNVPIRLLTHGSRCRAQAAHARQLAMYLSHIVLGCSLKDIAKAFGRDRTTVSYACGVIEDLRDDPTFDAEVSALEEKIGSLGVDND